ncbi:MAG: hypothetical protein WD407_07485 [Rhodospirillales bacterium]
MKNRQILVGFAATGLFFAGFEAVAAELESSLAAAAGGRLEWLRKNPRGRKAIRLFARGAAVVLICLLALEAMSAAAVHLRLVPAHMPNYRWPSFNPFWADTHAAFGVWHGAHSRYTHVTDCYNLEYKANGHGMRDRPRSLDADRPRVAMLGDSFLEGYGLAREDRVSDRLETETGVPHLNFGTSGSFGPTQYFLQYRSLVSRFDHAGVIVNLLPDNDFTDDDPEHWRKAIRERYRPYFFETEAPGRYRLGYMHENKLGESRRIRRQEYIRGTRNVLRNFTYSARVINYFQGWAEYAIKTDGRSVSGTVGHSGYYDYTPDQARRFRYVLSRLIEESEPRPVLFVVMPRPVDIERYRSGEPPPLAGLLSAITRNRPHVAIIDLLEPFARADGADRFYNGCDGHWSPAGARFAFETIRADPVYKRFLSTINLVYVR